jgi:nuclear pore complex protein Nup205
LKHLQRAWLLKLLALELHVADTTEPAHHETCIAILSHTFSEAGAGDIFQADTNTTWNRTPLNKTKACHSLDFLLFTNKTSLYFQESF